MGWIGHFVSHNSTTESIVDVWTLIITLSSYPPIPLSGTTDHCQIVVI